MNDPSLLLDALAWSERLMKKSLFIARQEGIPVMLTFDEIAEQRALIARLNAAIAEGDKDAALIEAVHNWSGECEGVPNNPSDAELLKALWTYDGDNNSPCDDCDGQCDEPCAPCTVVEAHAALDSFSHKWKENHGFVQALPPPP